jgi:hypothetical protein
VQLAQTTHHRKKQTVTCCKKLIQEIVRNDAKHIKTQGRLLFDAMILSIALHLELIAFVPPYDRYINKKSAFNKQRFASVVCKKIQAAPYRGSLYF